MKFDLQNLTEEQKKILLIGALWVFVGVPLYVKKWWIPKSQDIAKDRQQLEVVNNQILEAKQAKRRLEILERELEAANQKAQEMEKKLPKTRDLPAVLDTVNRLALKHRVQLTSFGMGGISPKTYFSEIPFPLTISGKYLDIGRFLAAIGMEERIYNVKDLNFTPAPTLEDASKLSVTFTLIAYQYKG